MTAVTVATTGSITPPSIALRGVGQRYGTTDALHDLDLCIDPGSFVAVVGASGCGKSTLLRLLAGLDAPTHGAIDVDGDRPDRLRRAGQIGWMAQRPALLPWATVYDNVALARRIRPPRGDVPTVQDLLDLVSLEGVEHARPAELSGGMQQRAALARTLALDAPLWLMDEPFAALDELTREALTADLLDIWRRLRPTVVWVTHHLGEAATMADRIVVLPPRPGPIVADLPIAADRPRDPTAPSVQGIIRTARHHLRSADALTARDVR